MSEAEIVKALASGLVGPCPHTPTQTIVTANEQLLACEAMHKAAAYRKPTGACVRLFKHATGCPFVQQNKVGLVLYADSVL